VTGLPLLRQFADVGENSDYATQLEDALARAYLNTKNLERAEHFGLSAYQRAQNGTALILQDMTSETMAAIKRAQGQPKSAFAYYDINLALKKKILYDQVQKNLAYQRFKFDAQDKVNQKTLLQQKNTNLNVETVTQRGTQQNLVLLSTTGLAALTLLGAGFVRTLRQKNTFRKTAQIDGLTQVSNRAHFTECAQKAFNDQKNHVSLVLFDMDFFKKVNDTYGHATGDWGLQAVCHTIRRRLPKGAHMGRLGGEEFALCLPTFSEEEARAVAERCRKAIAAVDTRHSGFNFQMTASFGIATRTEKGLFSFEQALAAADKALYFSKNEGLKRVTRVPTFKCVPSVKHLKSNSS
jgi:diguanylate cyclase (GGDEF)-like protein